MTLRDREAGYRHGLRVRMRRSDGPRGKLLRCVSHRPGGRSYWKVRLDNGEWVWPDGLIVDGQGDHVNPECISCRLPFITRAGSGELACERCDEDEFGPARAAALPPAKRWNARRRWKRSP